MKYLIVTPDGVGSTFLQRAMTLLLKLDGRDVVNTHEITNGITTENGKICRPTKASYKQDAHEIITIIKNCSSPYMISRLAKYHLDNRNDEKFFIKLLDFIRKHYKNIILCKRKNVFEYALSWGLRHNSGHINVFSLKQKKEVRKTSHVDLLFFKKKLLDYKNYISWADDLFPKAKSIYYEDLVDDPEKIINLLGIYPHSFKKHFGLTLKDYIHIEYDLHEQCINKTKNIDSMINDIRKIARVKSYLNNLVKDKVMPAGTMPIKNTSLALKKQIVLNYDQCAKSYQEFCRNNNWADQTIMEFDFWGGKFV